MTVQTIEEWAESRIQTFPLSILSGAAIGVDASYYLDLRMNKYHREKAKGADANKHSHNTTKTSLEPLFSALNGTPYALEKILEDDIQALKKHDVSLIFVFNGLDYVNKEPAGSRSLPNMQAHEEAWRYYASNLKDSADLTSKAFGKADYEVEVIYRYFQHLLSKNQVEYLVAPYSALAQLSYMVKLQDQFIDAVMSTSESFLFNVDKIVLDFDKDQSSFSWLSKNDCQDYLERSSDDVFRDVQLLLGSSFLRTFPVLGRHPTNKVTVRDAFALLKSAGRSVIQLCQQFREDPLVQNLQYLDRYKKAIMTIRHHVVLEVNGVVSPLDYEHAPGDVHEFIGQRLPEELFFYISRGIIGPRIPSWLASGEMSFVLPTGVLDHDGYRRLVIEQLNPLRATTLRLLADSMHRYYHTRVVKVRAWFDKDTADLTITMREVPPFTARLSAWKIHEAELPEAVKEAKKEQEFLATLKSLQAKSSQGNTDSKSDITPLKTLTEIVYNVMCRFLQVRGYVSEEHELTAWGKVLVTALETLEPGVEAEENILLGIEMLRLGLFDGNDFTIGSTTSTPDRNRTMTNLVSRVACLGWLKHKALPYSGPMDRQLSTFAWMITAVRSSLRDLVETILACMFLNGVIDRDRNDWSHLAIRLPFIAEEGCGLGLALKTYLDDLHIFGKENDKEMLKEQIKDQEDVVIKKGGKDQDQSFKYFKHATNLRKSLEFSYRIWDAIYAGSQVAPKEFKDAKLFTEANTWLAALMIKRYTILWEPQHSRRQEVSPIRRSITLSEQLRAVKDAYLGKAS